MVKKGYGKKGVCGGSDAVRMFATTGLDNVKTVRYCIPGKVKEEARVAAPISYEYAYKFKTAHRKQE